MACGEMRFSRTLRNKCIPNPIITEVNLCLLIQPNTGDLARKRWPPRIAKGNDALLSSVKNGLKAMPPKVTCMSCSEDELRAAMEYMVGQGS